MRSPVLRCTKLKSSLSFVHCVPLPLPGPPAMKTTKGGVVRSVTLFSSASADTSTSMIVFFLAGGGASTEKGRPSWLTPYSTKRLLRSGGWNFFLASGDVVLGLFSANHLLSHFTAPSPFGCTWQRAMRPREMSICSVGSTVKSVLSASRLFKSMEAPADLRKRKSRTSPSSGMGSAPISGKKKLTSRAAALALALPWTAFRWPSEPQRARREFGLWLWASFTDSGPIICCHTVTASSRQSTRTQQGPATASLTMHANWGLSL
mmetsp:Transcript_25398/g.73251  ORF Transcript_25398/g.73251 Transcript_25398/m.73251 type:complete len:263 (-) Transcript_25398:1188-1976(-)